VHVAVLRRDVEITQHHRCGARPVHGPAQRGAANIEYLSDRALPLGTYNDTTLDATGQSAVADRLPRHVAPHLARAVRDSNATPL
jgi:hypothetical protein